MLDHSYDVLSNKGLIHNINGVEGPLLGQSYSYRPLNACCHPWRVSQLEVNKKAVCVFVHVVVVVHSSFKIQMMVI